MDGKIVTTILLLRLKKLNSVSIIFATMLNLINVLRQLFALRTRHTLLLANSLGNLTTLQQIINLCHGLFGLIQLGMNHFWI